MMRSIAVCWLFISLNVFALTPEEIRLWEKEPAPTSNEIPSDAEDNRNLDWIMNVSDPTVTVYPADNPNGMSLLMCPGGAYIGLAGKHEGSDLAEILNSRGITLAVLKYRMPNGHHEVPADDARQAIRILRRNADKWGINPERIGIGGASAGGHLASTIATHPMDMESAVDFQVLIYPVISMQDSITHPGSKQYLLGENPSAELVDYYSNEKQVTSTTPRAFISTSIDDNVVPPANSFDYFDALTSNGIDVDMHIYPKGKHGWAFRPKQMPYHDQWLNDLTRWLDNLYADSDNQKSGWKGKKVAVLGDSMSDPRLKVTKKRFYDYLAETVGIIPLSYGVNGYQYKDLLGKARQMREEKGDSIDAVIIWAGTNDYNASIPIGSFYTEERSIVNADGKEVKRKQRILSDDGSTFCGNINNLLGYLKTEYPEKTIIIMTPIHRGYAKFSEKNVQPSEEYANGLGLYIDDYVKALKEAGSVWSVPVIDLYSQSGILPALQSNTRYIANETYDRLHPNDLGHQKIANAVEGHLKVINCR